MRWIVLLLIPLAGCIEAAEENQIDGMPTPTLSSGGGPQETVPDGAPLASLSSVEAIQAIEDMGLTLVYAHALDGVDRALLWEPSGPPLRGAGDSGIDGKAQQWYIVAHEGQWEDGLRGFLVDANGVQNTTLGKDAMKPGVFPGSGWDEPPMDAATAIEHALPNLEIANPSASEMLLTNHCCVNRGQSPEVRATHLPEWHLRFENATHSQTRILDGYTGNVRGPYEKVVFHDEDFEYTDPAPSTEAGRTYLLNVTEDAGRLVVSISPNLDAPSEPYFFELRDPNGNNPSLPTEQIPMLEYWTIGKPMAGTWTLTERHAGTTVAPVAYHLSANMDALASPQPS